MRFIVFALIFPFLLYLCKAAASHAPKHSKTTEPAAKAYSFLGDLHPTKGFKKRCRNKVERFTGQRVFGRDDECILYCAFVELDWLRSNANLNTDTIWAKLPSKHRTTWVLNDIKRCATTSNSGNVCSKAVRNADCALRYVSRDSTELEIISVTFRE